MKSEFLNQLKQSLVNLKASQKDIDDIILDYDQLYEDALNSGKTDEDVLEMLGSPDDIIQDLLDTIQLKKEKGIKNKIIALMPFISLIVFFVLGFYQDLWSVAWLVFFSIPISAILLQTRLKDGLIALTPFLSVIIFLILGWGYGLWNPGWLVFLLIPMASILLKAPLKTIPIAISPFVAVIAFFILGFYYNLWNPGWLVFLIIPMLGILNAKNKIKLVLYELSFITAIGFYLYMGYINDSWTYGAFGFILPFLMGIILSDVHFQFSDFKGPQRKKSIILTTMIVVISAIFIALGFIFNGWGWAWQIFLLIPVIAIILFDKFRWTALMPFIAVIIFFSLGYFFDIFQISWLAFLLIPITAIIENA
ncbi:MAG: DUF1700 domain-containing protein [Acholeplasmataceae bacterium]|nr:DUF1700 domain-containing protein [Acholeplasmataceae bacterium]